MASCGTDDDNRRTREDKATQPLDAGRLSFAIYATSNSFSKRRTGCVAEQGEVQNGPDTVDFGTNTATGSRVNFLPAV